MFLSMWEELHYQHTSGSALSPHPAGVSVSGDTEHVQPSFFPRGQPAPRREVLWAISAGLASGEQLLSMGGEGELLAQDLHPGPCAGRWGWVGMSGTQP